MNSSTSHLYLILRSTSVGRIAENLRAIDLQPGSAWSFVLPWPPEKAVPAEFAVGQRALLVLSEDARQYLPFRAAVISQAIRSGSYLALDLELGHWQLPRTTDTWSEAFSVRLDRDAPYVLVEFPYETLEAVDQLPTPYWETLAAHMVAQARFFRTLFYRIEHLRPTAAGTDLVINVWNPHLEEGSGNYIRVTADLDGAEMTLAEIDAHGTGTRVCRIPAVAVPVRATVRAHPYRARSLAAEVAIPPTTPSAQVPAPHQVLPNSQGAALSGEAWVGSILKFITRQLDNDPRLQRVLLEEYLYPLAPEHPTIRSRLAHLCLKDEPATAYELLRSIPAGERGEDAALDLLAAAARCGERVDLEEVLLLVNTDSAMTIERLRLAVASATEALGLKLLESLVGRQPLLSEQDGIRLLGDWSDTWASPASTAMVVQLVALYVGDLAAYNYFRRKAEQSPGHWEDAVFREKVREVVVARCMLPNREDVFLQLAPFAHQDQSGGGLLGLIADARRCLGRTSHILFLQQLTRETSPYGSPADQAQIYLELSRLYREEDRPLEAADALAAVRHLAGAEPSLLGLVEGEQSALEAYLEETEVLQEYRRAQESHQLAMLRKHLGGKQILIVNGVQQPWVESLEKEIGVGVRWYASTRDHKINLEQVHETIRSGHPAVVALNTWQAAHSGMDQLRERCRHLGIKCCYVPKPAKRSLLEELTKVLDG